MNGTTPRAPICIQFVIALIGALTLVACMGSTHSPPVGELMGGGSGPGPIVAVAVAGAQPTSDAFIAGPVSLATPLGEPVGDGDETLDEPAAPEPASEPAQASSQPSPPPPVRVRALPPPPVAARAAIVVDGASGAVLLEHNAHTPLPPASTTKILTALLALERGRLDEVIEVRLDGRAYWGSVMGLVNGDRFTLRDLLYGLMLPSGNDAAYVIATHFAPTERAFADQMTARMRELGLWENVFINASGLGRDESNLVSAYDLAQLARYAMANPEFARIVGTTVWTARGSRVIGMRNGNGLLYALPGADGVKIGWGGRTAGNTIVGSATRDGHRVFVALLNVPDRDGEAAALLRWAFASFAWPAP